jgi:hypothetical protein
MRFPLVNVRVPNGVPYRNKKEPKYERLTLTEGVFSAASLRFGYTRT